MEPETRFIDPLTPRELDVLRLVCEGHSNDEISDVLGIQVTTVKYHINNVFGKLDVRRHTQAVALAVHLNIVIPNWLSRHVCYRVDHLLAKERTSAVSRLAESSFGRGRAIEREDALGRSSSSLSAQLYEFSQV